jgi:hypothetical protein
MLEDEFIELQTSSAFKTIVQHHLAMQRNAAHLPIFSMANRHGR